MPLPNRVLLLAADGEPDPEDLGLAICRVTYQIAHEILESAVLQTPVPLHNHEFRGDSN
jgi:hypothetical protein